MSERLLIVLISFPVWLTLILLFRKHRQWLFYYLFASFGLTLMMVLTAEHFGWDQIMVNIGSFHTSLLAKVLGIPNELLSNARLMLPASQGGTTILKLGIECSAILEASILVSLIFFYPAFRPRQKLLKIIFGLAITYVINILRMLIILYITYRYGSDSIYIAHALIARFFFFAAVIALYWYIITKPSIKAVGLAIRNGVKVDHLTASGREASLVHSLAQATAVILILSVGLASFGWSKDWQKAFGKLPPKQERPIIYPDETETETLPEVSGEQTEIILAPLIFNETEKHFAFQNTQPVELLGLVAQGPGTLKFSLQINGQVIKEEWLDKDSQEIDWPAIKLETGDRLIVKLATLQDAGEFKLSLKLRNRK